MAYDTISTSNSDLLPVEYAREVIKEASEQSVVMGLSRRLTLGARTTVMPAQNALALAYFVGAGIGDSTGLKQTTRNEWSGVFLRVEEIAALVAIPDAYMQDSQFPVWDETKPSLVEAIGAAIDAACLFGVNLPATWSQPIYQSAFAAGNTVLSGLGTDLAQSIAFGARDLRRDQGYRTSGFAWEPGFEWELVGLRDANGTPIYQTNLSGPINTGLYGKPSMEAGNGAWDSDEARLIGGDWGRSMFGIRQDITFTRHDSGVINDDAGAVVFNAMQQDSTIWRAVIRCAWATAKPVTRIGQAAGLTEAQRYPFWVLLNQSGYDYS